MCDVLINNNEHTHTWQKGIHNQSNCARTHYLFKCFIRLFLGGEFVFATFYLIYECMYALWFADYFFLLFLFWLFGLPEPLILWSVNGTSKHISIWILGQNDDDKEENFLNRNFLQLFYTKHKHSTTIDIDIFSFHHQSDLIHAFRSISVDWDEKWNRHFAQNSNCTLSVTTPYRMWHSFYIHIQFFFFLLLRTG